MKIPLSNKLILFNINHTNFNFYIKYWIFFLFKILNLKLSNILKNFNY